MSNGWQEVSEQDSTSDREQTPGGAVLLEAPTSPQPESTSSKRQYVVEEEITVSVPLVRPKQDFLFILKQAGARGEVFTRKEICFFLKNYIGSRKLYDPNDPRVVYCKEDFLGKVFGVENFTIDDVLCLLSENCTSVPDTCIKRKRHIVSRSVSTSSQTTEQPETTEVSSVASSEVITSTTSRTTCNSSSEIVTPQNAEPEDRPLSCQKRRQDGGSTDSNDGEGPVRKRKTSLNVTYNDSEASSFPWYFSVKMEKSDESEILSVQDKETVLVKDSPDEKWFVEGDEISVAYESDAFSVEYEVESNLSEVTSESDNISEVSGEDMLVVCNDSDVPFWASSEMESESDSELSDADKWTCGECQEKNSPVQRYCSRCWKLRPDWLPDFHNQPVISSSRKTFTRSFSAPGVVSSPESTTSDSSRTSCSTVKLYQHPAQRNKTLSNVSSYSSIASSSQPPSSSTSALCNSRVEHFYPDSQETSPAFKKIARDESCLSTVSYSQITETGSDKSSRFVSSNHAETVPVSRNSEQDQKDLKKYFFTNTSTADMNRFSFCDDCGTSEGTRFPFTISSQESMKHTALFSGQNSQSLLSPHLSTFLEESEERCFANRKESSEHSSVKNEELREEMFSRDEIIGHTSCFHPQGNAGHKSRASSCNEPSGSLLDSNISSSSSKEGVPGGSVRKNNVVIRSSKKGLAQRDSKVDDIISSTDSTSVKPSPSKAFNSSFQASFSDMCMICLSRPKTASIIHGSSGHQVCCYTCAKRLKRKGKCCPVCRRSIQKVVRNFIL